MKNTHSTNILIFLLGLCTLAILPACGTPTASAAAAGNSQACPEQNPPTSYYAQTGSDVERVMRDIYATYVSNPNSDIGLLKKNEALYVLASQVYSKSDFYDTRDANNNTYRILVTLIHPELAEAIVLNHLISTNQPSNPGFDAVSQAVLAQLAKRNEYMFIITVVSSQFNPNVSTLPAVPANIKPSDFILENTSGKTVVPQHHENTMDHTLDLANSYGSAIVGYPMMIKEGTNCIKLLDETFDTTITISLPKGSIGELVLSDIAWSIPFKPAATLQNSYKMPAQTELTGVGDEYFNPPIVPLEAPPTPPLAQDKMIIYKYWRDSGRFDWYKLQQYIVNLLAVTP